MKSDGVKLAAFYLLIACVCCGHLSWASEKKSWKLFILHSYEKNHICGQPQHEGVLAGLEEKGFSVGKNVTLKTYYMDTKSKNNTPALIAEQAEKALALIRQFKPDVLVTLDDNAFRTVALNLVDTPVQIVFSGMNNQPEEYNKIKNFMTSWEKPEHNVTGVYEKLHIADALRIQQKIFPDLQKVRMLTDMSPTGQAITKQINRELADSGIPLAFDIKVVATWEEYQDEIKTINESSDIGTIYPVALLLKDYAGKTITAPEILRWTVDHCRKPAISLNYSFTHLGLFGGAAVDFEAMGREVGEKVAQIFSGKKAGDVPIAEALRYALVFNLERIKRLRIDIPADILLAADEIVTSRKGK
ncbi:MAG: hypothetical protein KQH63_06775 [Desulfobulbaceae bacterium]|nr:hypothetical protein [Desulfobulbaceae bacterium]